MCWPTKCDSELRETLAVLLTYSYGKEDAVLKDEQCSIVERHGLLYRPAALIVSHFTYAEFTMSLLKKKKESSVRLAPTTPAAKSPTLQLELATSFV